MTSEILKIDDLSAYKDSGEIYAKIQPPYSKYPNSPDSLAIIWEDCTGTLDGKLTVYTGLLAGIKSKAFEIDINSADNSDDAEIIMFALPIETIRFEYVPNGISGGKLKAVMSYGGKHAC